MAGPLPPKIRDRLERALRARDPRAVRRDHDLLVRHREVPAAALYQLAMLEAGQEAFVLADRLMTAAGDRAPGEATIGVNHAQIKLALDDGAAALALLDRLTPAVRANPAVLRLTAEAALAADRPELAAAAYRELMKAGGGEDPAILTNLGTALRRLGRFEEAAHALRRAIDSFSSREAVVNLAGLHVQTEQPERGVALLRAHLDRRADDAVLLRHLASTHRSAGDGRAARIAACRALVLAPGDAQAITVLAEIAESVADLTAADDFARKALASAPGTVGAALVRAAVARRSGDVRAALDIVAAHTAGAPPASRHLLLFERARGLEALRESEAAIVAFAEANAVQWETAKPRRDPARAMAQLTALTALHSIGPPVPAGGSEGDGEGDGGDDLLFVVGFPRSGTTLLDQVLDAHPAIEVIEERPLIAAMIADLTTTGRRYPEDLPALTADERATLRARYRERLATHTRRDDARYTVDKMPLNLVHVALIRLVFPRARFILALRHPCDVVLSCFMQSFALNDWMAAFVTLKGTADMYAAAFGAWESYLAAIPTPVLSVRYEDVVDDLEREARRIATFLDLPYDPAMLAFHEHARTRSRLATPSAAQVTQPIYRTALARWRRYGSVMDPVAARLAPEIARYGYSEDST